MNFQFPCTHPDTWICKPSDKDPARCVGQTKYEAWVVAEEAMRKAGKVYITGDPDLVGDVDMTHTSKKLPLGHVGPASPCCDAPGKEHEPECPWRHVDDDNDDTEDH